MVARGDLGLEMPLERVPRVQKEITRRARARGRAGHRRDAGARVDAHRAAADARRGERRGQRRGRRRRRHHAGGRDGRRAYPVRAVQTLDAIIRDAEALPPMAVGSRAPDAAEHGRALCEAAVTLADRGHAGAIVAVTRGGNTARMLAALRPAATVLAATDSPDVARRLMLYRGVRPSSRRWRTTSPAGDAVGRARSMRVLSSLVRPWTSLPSATTRRSASRIS